MMHNNNECCRKRMIKYYYISEPILLSMLSNVGIRLAELGIDFHPKNMHISDYIDISEIIAKDEINKIADAVPDCVSEEDECCEEWED